MAQSAQQMLTANRLVTGDVVYWHAGGWVEAFAEGDVFTAKPDAEAALAAAQRFVAENQVVNPYLFEVRDDRRPAKEREIIRSRGPSIHPELGKQADGLAPPLEVPNDPPRPPPGSERDDDVSI